MSESGLVSDGWTLAQWAQAYRSGQIEPGVHLSQLLERLSTTDPAWISLISPAQLEQQLQQLLARESAAALPLYGIPFAVKDNIDVSDLPTTAACPAFGYQPSRDAEVVARLKAAGAIVLGKTNLDQFATGLVGTRSPYGAVANSFHPEYISGGSSSGSASVVARGLMPFSLGTDTAGSGRVPAAFNNIVGLKPTRGWFSTQGIVPACRTLDCVSVFALTVTDAEFISRILAGYDAADPYSRRCPQSQPVACPARPRLAIPDRLEFLGDLQAQQCFEQSLQRLREAGATLEPIEFEPFRQLARLLYDGPWVAERYVTAESLINTTPQHLDPSVGQILADAPNRDLIASFKAEYQRAALAQRIQQLLAGFDALVVPTAATHYRLAEVAEEPLVLNSNLGLYTNFTNLADLSALAIPAGFRPDGLPFGISLIAPAWHDAALADLGKRLQQDWALPLGATGLAWSEPAPVEPPLRPDSVRLAVVGAHLTGMPLNGQLTQRGAVLVEACRTASQYRLYALANTTPAKPGLMRDPKGVSIDVELWDIPLARFGEFVAEIPPPLGIGTLLLADGRQVKGFICEAWALQGATDISQFGGWRAYIHSLQRRS